MTTPPPAPGAPTPAIGRYELVGELATGGMAVVYLARLAGVGGFQRLFALKRLHPHLARETEFVAMFLDEARLAASVRNAHVVPILEVGISAEGDHFVVMEYVEGASLASLVASACQQQGRVPTSVALRVALDALAGLHAAHEARDEQGAPLELVHRDVSPHNVLVGVDGVARLTDFGIARAATRLSATRDGTFKGKLSYMAPEQASGGEVDRRADVFAAAIIIWELLANRRLFKGTNDLHTVHLVLYDPIPRLSDYNPAVPAALDDALARALDREPAARFGTAAEFAEALEGALGGWSAVASARDLAAFVEATAAAGLARQREIARAHTTQVATLRTAALPSVTPTPLPAMVAGSATATAMTSPMLAERPGLTPTSTAAPGRDEGPPRRAPLAPGLVAGGAVGGLVAVGVLGLAALTGAPRRTTGATDGRPADSTHLAAPAEIAPSAPAATPSSAPSSATSTAADAASAPSASPDARPARPPRPMAGPAARPADSGGDGEYPGLNPYR